MGETFDVIFATCISLLALAATVQLKQKSRPNCSPGSRCTVSLGKAGVVDLPATIAFQTAHKTYFSCLPPSGYSLPQAMHQAHLAKFFKLHKLPCARRVLQISWLACEEVVTDFLPAGGEPSFIDDDGQLDALWELIDEGADMVSLRSFHGTYLSSDDSPGKHMKHAPRVLFAHSPMTQE